jgi:hypothetical protein
LNKVRGEFHFFCQNSLSLFPLFLIRLTLSKWVSEWVTEWVSEWVSECPQQVYHDVVFSAHSSHCHETLNGISLWCVQNQKLPAIDDSESTATYTYIYMH